MCAGAGDKEAEACRAPVTGLGASHLAAASQSAARRAAPFAAAPAEVERGRHQACGTYHCASVYELHFPPPTTFKLEAWPSGEDDSL